MRKILVTLILAATGTSGAMCAETFAYAAPDGNSGLNLAWRADAGSPWVPLGYDFVRNDFGPWGSHKKMYSPRLFVDGSNGLWTAVWKATSDGSVTAMATSPDLTTWSPQRYFASPNDLPRDMHPSVPVRPDSATIDGKRYGGYIVEMPDETLDKVKSFVAERKRLAELYAEETKDDATRFAGLKDLTLKVVPEPAKAKEISDKLIGIFFEDINYGADGGLYAELVQNRDFEYAPSDRGGDQSWNSTKAWETGDGTELEILTADPLSANNPHYASLKGLSSTLTNRGFDFISVRKGERYDFSMYVRSKNAGKATVSLVDESGKRIASAKVKIAAGDWQKVSAVVRPSATCPQARLSLNFEPGTVDVDMVSLFPEKTFKGRKNGLRADLAQTLADLQPRFVRFPGGCVAHGDGIDNIYDWKGSIGPLQDRKPLRNLWGYHQTRGLGYHEYFLFCEDIGAEPLPVLAAGVPCQNSGTAAHHSDCDLTKLGQQNGIPMDEMDEYIQDVLDLIEYANGSVDSKWGAIRAAAGHPEPFNLKYIGIGNEDMITEVFKPRFKMIYDAVREAHPEITVVGTVGPFYEGTDYEEGWELARELEIPIVDEHYYVSPGWLIYNRDYYDKYPRKATKVYLGEYASHLPGRPSNLEAALSDALYLTDVERNADVVEMTSYAPLLAKKDHTQWRPDLIYFDNTSVNLTPDYYVQWLYGNNSGTTYVPSVLSFGPGADEKARARVGVSIVKDDNGGYILKMVNMLPVEVKVNVDLTPLAQKSGQYKATVLSGNPDDLDAVPVHITVSLPEAAMPPYSFTVVRF